MVHYSMGHISGSFAAMANWSSPVEVILAFKCGFSCVSEVPKEKNPKFEILSLLGFFLCFPNRGVQKLV